MVTPKKITDDELSAVRGLSGAMDAFFALRGTMPAQYIKAFLLVAEEQGLGVGDYAKRAGVSVSVMSRHLLDIGERDRNMEDGLGLVTYRSNPMELRKHEYYLTDKGRALVHRITRSLQK